MSVDGVWKIEMLGAYGWEPVSIAFLHDGRYWSGGSNTYAIGRYEVDGTQVHSELTVYAHAGTKKFLGRDASRYRLNFDGELTGETITGAVTEDSGEFLVRHRATKIGELP